MRAKLIRPHDAAVEVLTLEDEKRHMTGRLKKALEEEEAEAAAYIRAQLKLIDEEIRSNSAKKCGRQSFESFGNGSL